MNKSKNVSRGLRKGNIDLLEAKHMSEMNRKAAKAIDFALYKSATVIESRTTKGRLNSQIDPSTKHVTHVWMN